MAASGSGEEALGEENQGTLLDERRAQNAPHPTGSSATTRSGLAQLTGTALVFVVFAALPIALLLLPGTLDTLPRPLGVDLEEEIGRLALWHMGDGFPVVRMFTAENEAAGGMEVATGGASGRVARGAERAALSDQLGEAVAANLEEETSEGATEMGPSPGPVDGEENAAPAVRIDPSELEGLVLELEDEHGRAMRPFYDALLATARRRPGALTRVAHYGDSSIAGDGITMTMRRRMQQRFGDGGHGFILVARGTMPYRHHDVLHRSSGWDIIQLIRGGLRGGNYGYGGVQSRAISGARSTFGTSDRGPVGGGVSRFELWYQRHPQGGDIWLRVDSGSRTTLSTRAADVTDAWHEIRVPDGAHRLEVQAGAHGRSHIYGVVMERDGPGVVYDSLGLVGARARRVLHFDPQHFAAQLAHREPNLVVVGFGGNDADDIYRTPEQFRSDFSRLARLVRRSRPQAACLIMAPLDQGERDERGRVRTMRQVPVIVAAARAAARAEGCAFFDTFSAMGGEGAMGNWLRARPRLAFGDLRHASVAGYRVIGNMFYKAILKGFADYLARTGNGGIARRGR